MATLEKIDITHDLLIKNGFEFIPKKGAGGWDDFNEYRWSYSAINENDNLDYKRSWRIDVKHNMSNTADRDWGVHIDNQSCESVAYVDIQTVEHFNTLMELMEIEFRLSI